jgi:hypothetical protein
MRSLAHRTDAAQLVDRLRRLHPDSPARWGRMSAPQMICHVADALRMALGRKEASPVGGLLHRTVVKWIVLYVPLRWPPGIATRPELDQDGGGTAPAEFAVDVSEVESLLALVAAGGSPLQPLHPIFGRMSRRGWLRWAYLHTDHHLRQFGM